MMHNMLAYNKTALLNLDDAYQRLVVDSSLTANLDVIEELSAKEQVKVATDLILTCPSSNIPALTQKVETLQSDKTLTHPFAYVMKKGLAIHSTFENARDPKNTAPYQFIFEEESYPNHFNEFHALSNALANRHAIELAARLAHATPQERVPSLFRQVRIVFKDSDFATMLGQAYLVKDMLSTLNGPEPHKAFLDEDFSPALFHRFTPLANDRLTNLQAIATKLTQVPEKHLDNVKDALTSLAPPNEEPLLSNPFHALKSHFIKALTEQTNAFDTKQKSALQKEAVSHSGFFQQPTANHNDPKKTAETISFHPSTNSLVLPSIP